MIKVIKAIRHPHAQRRGRGEYVQLGSWRDREQRGGQREDRHGGNEARAAKKKVRLAEDFPQVPHAIGVDDTRDLIRVY